MKIRILLNGIVLAVSLMIQSLALAAEGAAAAGQPQHDMAASEHAGHGEHGMGKPMTWTDFPVLIMKMNGESRTVTVVPQGIVANSIGAYSNDIRNAGGQRQLPLDMAGARLDKPETGGFHWLAAREEQDGKVRVASTVYFFSGSGKNPTAMFMQQKHELEIIPQPFPREHSRYRTNEDWKFLVRFNSKPLANQKVNLETQNGTKTGLVSDAQGLITAHLPDDFKSETEQKISGKHSHERRSSDFVLATEYAEGGKTYLTAFNSSYGPDAFDQRSLAMGLGFTLLGMIGAAPLLWQRKPAKQAASAGPSATDESAKNGEA